MTNKKILTSNQQPDQPWLPPWAELELPKLKEKITLVLLDPNGNRTALVKNTQRSAKLMKVINDAIMTQQAWQVEQVGFYDSTNRQTATLWMAGGELCVNAIRALAFLVLNGQEGVVAITAAPNRGVFMAGVTQDNQTGEIQSWVELPLPNSEPLSSEILGPTGSQVSMNGINHLVVERKLHMTVEADSLDQIALNALKKANLIDNQDYPAAGVMFYQLTNRTTIELYPVVWVRDVKTLFAENACGSGTLATIATLLKQGYFSNTARTVIQVIQTTSGELLFVEVDQSRQSAIIRGRTNWVAP